jgi:hypothetical protein
MDSQGNRGGAGGLSAEHLLVVGGTLMLRQLLGTQPGVGRGRSWVLPHGWGSLGEKESTSLLSPGSFPSLQLVPQRPSSPSQALPLERACCAWNEKNLNYKQTSQRHPQLFYHS